MLDVNKTLLKDDDGKDIVTVTFNSKTLYVSNDFSNEVKPFFSNIQDAIDEAVSGDTVYVHAGTYINKITLKNGVDLFFEPNSAIYITDGSGTTPVVQGTNVDCRIIGKPDITIDDDPITINAIAINGSSNVYLDLGVVTGDVLFDTLTTKIDLNAISIPYVLFKNCNTSTPCFVKADIINQLVISGTSAPGEIDNIFCYVKYFNYLEVRNIGQVFFNFDYGLAEFEQESVLLKRGSLFLHGKTIVDDNEFAIDEGTIHVHPDLIPPLGGYYDTSIEINCNVKCTDDALPIFLRGMTGLNVIKNAILTTGYSACIDAIPFVGAVVKVFSCQSNVAKGAGITEHVSTITVDTDVMNV